MQLDKEITESFGKKKGLIEDLFPWLVNIRPSAKYKRMVEIMDEGLGIMKKKFRQHQETFDPGI